jgi:hypothetical protein
MTITPEVVPGIRKRSRTMQQMAPSPPRPVTTPLCQSRYRSDAASLSTPAYSRGRPEWNDSPEVKSEDDSEDYDDYTPGDVHVESACQGYRILPIRSVIDSYKNALCRQCLEQTPPLETTILCEEVTYGIATEIFCRCNAKGEHGDRTVTHSWEILADRRPAPPGGEKKLTMASFTINYWLMAVMQYWGLGISHIEAFLGFLGLKGQVGNKKGWQSLEECLGDGEEEHKESSIMVPHGYSL